MTAINKRQYKRYEINFMDIKGKIMFANEVQIKDLSLGGVALKAERRLNIGSEYILKMENKDGFITVKGSIVWSSLTATRPDGRGDVVPVYVTGMRFTDISNHKLNQLVDFIRGHNEDKDLEVEMHGMSGLRCNLRFNIENVGKAILNVDEAYRVKKISMGGMLIESGHLIDVEDRLHMDLALVEDVFIRFCGRVASCLKRSSDTAERYDIGIEFINIQQQDRLKIQEFIEKLPSEEVDFSRQRCR